MKSVKKQVYGQVWRQLEDQVLIKVWHQVRWEVCRQVDGQVWRQVRQVVMGVKNEIS